MNAPSSRHSLYLFLTAGMRALIIFLYLLQELLCLKILVYAPKFSHSHSNYFGVIADTLADAGHNVTSLVPIVDSSLSDGPTRSSIIHLPPSDEVVDGLKSLIDMGGDLLETPYLDVIGSLRISSRMSSLFRSLCQSVLSHRRLLLSLQQEHFDILVAENFDMCGVGLSQLLRPSSLITASTTSLAGYAAGDVGVPFYAHLPSGALVVHDPHSMINRAWNMAGEVLARAVHGVWREEMGEDFPSWTVVPSLLWSEWVLQEIASHSALVLSNSDPLLDFAHPTLHKVIHIGGITIKTPKPLDQKWMEIVERRNATALISFGSTARSSSFKPAIKRAILKMISTFPWVTFIWKYEERDSFSVDEASTLSNLILSPWVPQSDLLAHPNMTLFISHAGMNSVQESAWRGVPGLFIPLFADQPRNALVMEHIGMGRALDKILLVDADALSEGVRELLHNHRHPPSPPSISPSSYTANARRLSRMLGSRPWNGKERLLREVEGSGGRTPPSAPPPST